MDLTVKFLVIATDTVVEKQFDSYYECRKFVNKLRRSRKLRLISYPDVSR